MSNEGQRSIASSSDEEEDEDDADEEEEEEGQVSFLRAAAAAVGACFGAEASSSSSEEEEQEENAHIHWLSFLTALAASIPCSKWKAQVECNIIIDGGSFFFQIRWTLFRIQLPPKNN